jgi:hypothetical protein
MPRVKVRVNQPDAEPRDPRAAIEWWEKRCAASLAAGKGIPELPGRRALPVIGALKAWRQACRG